MTITRVSAMSNARKAHGSGANEHSELRRMDNLHKPMKPTTAA